MGKQLILFANPTKPRAKPQKRMQIRDAGSFPDGEKAIHFECPHCGYDDDWTYQTESNSEAKRGRPCPACNG